MVNFNLAICALAVLACVACTVLLFRGYFRSRQPLVFWSSVCFVFLTLNNILLFVDLVILEMDLRPWRHAAAFAGVFFMIFGLLREPK